MLHRVETSPDDVLVSVRAERDFPISAHRHQAPWSGVPHVALARTFSGELLPGPPTIVRSRWTDEALYLRFDCPYDTLTLRPEVVLTEKTPYLWNWDVAEAFIGSGSERARVYKEFQVSPRGEWVDLAIDLDDGDLARALAWRSNLTVRAHIDDAARVWHAEMRIPFADIDTARPVRGHSLRLGLFRLSGREPRTLHLWRPTGRPNFHVPEAFGRLLLGD